MKSIQQLQQLCILCILLFLDGMRISKSLEVLHHNLDNLWLYYLSKKCSIAIVLDGF